MGFKELANVIASAKNPTAPLHDQPHEARTTRRLIRRMRPKSPSPSHLVLSAADIDSSGSVEDVAKPTGDFQDGGSTTLTTRMIVVEDNGLQKSWLPGMLVSEHLAITSELNLSTGHSLQIQLAANQDAQSPNRMFGFIIVFFMLLLLLLLGCCLRGKRFLLLYINATFNPEARKVVLARRRGTGRPSWQLFSDSIQVASHPLATEWWTQWEELMTQEDVTDQINLTFDAVAPEAVYISRDEVKRVCAGLEAETVFSEGLGGSGVPHVVQWLEATEDDQAWLLTSWHEAFPSDAELDKEAFQDLFKLILTWRFLRHVAYMEQPRIANPACCLSVMCCCLFRSNARTRTEGRSYNVCVNHDSRCESIPILRGEVKSSQTLSTSYGNSIASEEDVAEREYVPNYDEHAKKRPSSGKGSSQTPPPHTRRSLTPGKRTGQTRGRSSERFRGHPDDPLSQPDDPRPRSLGRSAGSRAATSSGSRPSSCHPPSKNDRDGGDRLA